MADGESACLGDTNQVGSYPLEASLHPLLDMNGNVQEWLRDVYNK